MTFIGKEEPMNQLIFSVTAILLTTAAISVAHRQSAQASQPKIKPRKHSNKAIPLRKF